MENSELKDFFKQVLQIPSENLKEFIFDRKKYVKYEDDELKGVLYPLCWFVYEWCGDSSVGIALGDSWKLTDRVIITHARMINYSENWIYEGDMSEESPSEPVPLNKSGEFLVDLQ